MLYNHFYEKFFLFDKEYANYPNPVVLIINEYIFDSSQTVP